MHELHLTAADKAARYAQILPQLRAIIEDESDTVANLANTAAVLKEAFGWLWVGFYRVVGDELVLSAFQGPLACTRIARGRGVCGQAWGQNRTLIVPDVNAHPDHIVVPLRDASGAVWAVLDADAEALAVFDETDAQGLETIAVWLSEKHGVIA